MKDIVQAFHKLEFPINFLKNNLKWMNENKWKYWKSPLIRFNFESVVANFIQ
jgi:hypothetical protein